jgi:hypothetical protein
MPMSTRVAGLQLAHGSSNPRRCDAVEHPDPPMRCRTARDRPRPSAKFTSASVPAICGAPFAPARYRHISVGSTRRETAARRTQPRREELSGPLGQRPGVGRVVDEHEPHRPVPRSWLGKLVPGPEEPRQRHGGGGEPSDHPDGQDPRRRSQRHHDDARNGDGQPDVALGGPRLPSSSVRCICSSGGSSMPGICSTVATTSVIGPPGRSVLRDPAG